MGNNYSFDPDAQLPQINYNSRWAYCDAAVLSKKKHFFKPFSLSQSVKIEEAYELNKYYESKKDKIMIFFDYEHQQNHILVSSNDVWKQRQIIREQSIAGYSSKKKTHQIISDRIINEFNIEKILHFEDFPKALANQMKICPYNKIFENIDYNNDDFFDDFFKSYILVDNNLYNYLTEEYNTHLLENFKVNQYKNPEDFSVNYNAQINFDSFKDLLIEDFKNLSTSDSNIYIFLYLKTLSKANFTTNIIKIFNEEGSVYKKVLEMINKKNYKNKEQLILFYLSLIYSLGKSKYEETNGKFHFLVDKDNLKFDFYEDSYYYLNDMTICTLDELEDWEKTYVKIEVIYEKKLQGEKFPFFCQYPQANGSVYNCYKTNEVVLPQNSIIKCTRVSSKIIQFELVYDVLAQHVPFMLEKEKRNFFLFDDISVITNSLLFFERELIPNIKYTKGRQKTLKYFQKFLIYSNSLESLDCYGSELGNDNNLKIIASVFNFKPGKNSLKYLNLAGNEINARGILVLSQCFSSVGNTLTCLDLSFNAITDEAIENIKFKHLQCLEFLILKENHLTSKGAKYLSDNFIFMKNLLCLDLYDNKIEGEGLIFIAKKLKEATSLVKLDFFHCFIEDNGACEFFREILKLPNKFQYINLKQNNIGVKKEVVDIIIEVLIKFSSSLKVLNVDQNNINEADFMKIADAIESNIIEKLSIKKTLSLPEEPQRQITSSTIKIKSNRTLNYFVGNLNKYSYYTKSIDFSEYSDRSFDIAGLKKLFSFSLPLNSVMKIDFSFCQFMSSKELEIILNKLSRFENLTEFNLSSVNLSNKVETFNNHVSELCRIENLILSFNGIDELFLLQTIENFSYFISLKQLDLYGNSINDKGMELICESLHMQNSITSLNFGKNLIGDYGISKFIRCLKYLTNLIFLDFSMNIIGDLGFKNILNNFSFFLGLTKFDMRYNTISEELRTNVINQGIPRSFLI